MYHPIRQIALTLFFAVGYGILLSSEAFSPVVSMTHSPSISQFAAPQIAVVPSTSIEVAAATLDPTTLFSDLLGGLLGSPAILAVPILAALGVASFIAFLITSYANPQVEDDEY